MKIDQIITTVTDILTGYTDSDIKSTYRFDDIGMNSLDQTHFLMEIDDAFGIDLSGDCDTVGSVIVGIFEALEDKK